MTRRFVGACSLALIAAAAPAATARSAVAIQNGATGRICGATKCVPLPTALAVTISQRDESFAEVTAPKSAPYYRIRIVGKGEGYFTRTVIWVPSKKVWYNREYLPYSGGGANFVAGYWRTENAKAVPGLTQLIATIKPYPAPPRWAPALPK